MFFLARVFRKSCVIFSGCLRYYLIFSVVTFNLHDSRIDISSTIQIEKSLFDFLVALPPLSLSFFLSFFLPYVPCLFFLFFPLYCIVICYVWSFDSYRFLHTFLEKWKWFEHKEYTKSHYSRVVEYVENWKNL